MKVWFCPSDKYYTIFTGKIKYLIKDYDDIDFGLFIFGLSRVIVICILTVLNNKRKRK